MPDWYKTKTGSKTKTRCLRKLIFKVNTTRRQITTTETWKLHWVTKRQEKPEAQQKQSNTTNKKTGGRDIARQGERGFVYCSLIWSFFTRFYFLTATWLDLGERSWFGFKCSPLRFITASCWKMMSSEKLIHQHGAHDSHSSSYPAACLRVPNQTGNCISFRLSPASCFIHTCVVVQRGWPLHYGNSV